MSFFPTLALSKKNLNYDSTHDEELEAEEEVLVTVATFWASSLSPPA